MKKAFMKEANVPFGQTFQRSKSYFKTKLK